MSRAVIILAGLALAACGTTPAPEPVVRTVEVKVPIAQPCPDKRNPAPDFVDSVEGIKAALGMGSDKAFAVLLAGRDQRIQWQAESDAQIAACARQP